MQNIKLTLQYDGTRYLGWKRPEKDHNDRTVSYKIENVLEKVTGTPVTLFSGVRTEPGVHARNLTVNFLTESQLTPADIQKRSQNKWSHLIEKIIGCHTNIKRRLFCDKSNCLYFFFGSFLFSNRREMFKIMRSK